MTKVNLLRIEWEDSTARHIGWHDPYPNGNGEYEPTKITTVGWVVEEDEKSLSISHTISTDGMAYDSFVIPKGCITFSEVIADIEVEGPDETTQAQV